MAQKDSKKKKSHKGLVITLSIIGGLILVLASTLITGYVLISDDSSPTTEVDENYDMQTALTAKIYESFDNVSTNKGLKVDIGEEDFNRALMSISNKANQSNLRGIELDINEEDETYTFYVYLTAGILKTKVSLVTKLSQTDEAYIFSISSIKVGSIGGLEGIGMNLLSQVTNEDSINQIFTDSGFNMSVSFSDKSITYLKEDFTNDIKTLIKEAGGIDNSLYTVLIEDFFDMDLLSFDFFNNNSFSALIDFSSLSSNDYVTASQNLDDFVLSEYAAKLENLLANAYVDNDHANVVYEFLVKGYDSLDDAGKTYIDSVSGLDSVGIEDASSYQGYTSNTSTSLESYLIENLPSIVNSGSLDISETYFSDFLVTETEFIGSGYVYTYEGNQGDIIYVGVDNSYINLYVDEEGKERLALTLGLSINGYETVVAFDSVKQSSTNLSVTMRIDNILFGEHTLSDALKSEVFTIVEDALSSNSLLSFSAENASFTLDFEPYLADTIASLPSSVSLGLEFSISGSSIEEEGSMIITGSISY